MKIAVTGSNGFIGSALAAFLEKQGHEVERWQRNGSGIVAYDLTQSELPSLHGLDAVVHTAFIAFSASNPNAAQQNIEGTLRLKLACDRAGVFFLYLSSMSAQPHALSAYGKHKFFLQQQLQEAAVIRPGLVVGNGGLFGRLMTSVKKWPIQPLIAGGRQPLQIVALSDLLNAIDFFLVKKQTGVFTIAGIPVYTMKEILLAIGVHYGKRLFFLPLSYDLIATAIKGIQWLRLPLAITNENLLGLKQLCSENTAADLDQLPFELKNLKEALEELK